MNHSQFTEQMNRLIAQFGKAAYSTERVAMIWREVGNLEVEAFTTIMDEFVGSARQAPLVPDFRERVSVEREKAWNRQKQNKTADTWNPRPNCRVCNDNGVYVCVKADGSNDGFWAFRCHCQKGLDDPRRMIPHYKPAHASEFVYFDIEKHRQRMAMEALP